MINYYVKPEKRKFRKNGRTYTSYGWTIRGVYKGQINEEMLDKLREAGQ